MSDESGRWFVGDPSECPYDTARIAWDETPTPERLGEIHMLRLRPSPTQLLAALLPTWIAELPNCRELTLPIQHLAGLRSQPLPAGLDGLAFDADYRWAMPDGSHVPAWPAALILSELRRLTFQGYMSGIPAGLRPEHAPALEALSATLDKRGELIDHIVTFPRLRELDLLGVGSHDVFESLDGAITVLKLRGGSRRFPFDAISRWPTIERLELDHMQGGIDCVVLSELPALIELRLSYCKQLVDVEALLDCPRLRELTVTRCGSFVPALRQAFAEHGFDRLELGRA